MRRELPALGELAVQLAASVPMEQKVRLARVLRALRVRSAALEWLVLSVQALRVRSVG